MAGLCPRNAWSKNRKNGFKGEVKGDPKGCWILEPGFPDCMFSCQVL